MAQQTAADKYAPLLQKGRKVMVEWVDLSRKEPGMDFGGRSPEKDREREQWRAAIAEQRNAAAGWSTSVKNTLDGDFGPAVGVRFNLGKPADVSLGVSEPREHEARVLMLDTLIREMRAGALPLRCTSSTRAE